MSRKQLARKSGISERYVAQIEAGKGNVSIVLLLRIAYAIRAARDDAASLCRGPVSVAAIARLS